MPNWTEEQKQAIYEKGSNLLVAAAAGSRKNSSVSRKNYKQSNKRKYRYRQTLSSYIYKCSSFRNERKSSKCYH